MKRRVSIDKLVAASNQDRVGLRCPKCHCVQFGISGRGVRETRQVVDGVKRYRVCRNCGTTWVTIER